MLLCCNDNFDGFEDFCVCAKIPQRMTHFDFKTLAEEVGQMIECRETLEKEMEELEVAFCYNYRGFCQSRQ